MLVNNKTKRIITVPLKNGTNNRIMPGVNNVGAELWKQIAPQIKNKLESGEIEDVEDSVKTTNDFEEGLARYNPVNAKGLIKETADEEILREWLETEKREDVKGAIMDRLKEIEEAVTSGEGDE